MLNLVDFNNDPSFANSLLRRTHTLLRNQNVFRLFAPFPPTRARHLQEIEEVCIKQLQQMAANPTMPPEEMLAPLRAKLATRREGLLDIYEQLLSFCSTHQDASKALRRVMRDAEALKIPVIQKSSHGIKGPTLLVDVPKVTVTEEYQPVISSWRRGVIKWADWSEIASSRLYAFFARAFAVPNGIALDFTRREIVPVLQGQAHQIDERMCRQMQGAFAALKAPYSSSSSSSSSGSEIMISEKVVGENLFDFALSKYEKLEQPQKEALFATLARMAVLDLVFGNFDRFASVFWNDKADQYIFLALEANLGNAMVQWEESGSLEPRVFAIDNEIESVEHEQQYRLFLQQLFTTSDAQGEMAENMVQNFEAALSTFEDELQGRDIEAQKEKLRAFAREVRSLGKAAFIQGIKAEIAELPAKLAEWEGETGGELQGYLKRYFPGRYEEINARLRQVVSQLSSR